ncbi:sugar ABC transporter substrate-binding protein [Nonomuraea sp. NPDC050328]|uniref:sugar ABC transporter substrate-binding protein n=1 Tax=Nonomuraea sp. NPDC050328 TaxID=3364361 RepID=UPI0037B6ABA0
MRLATKAGLGLLAAALVLTGCGRSTGTAAPEQAKEVATDTPATGTVKVWAMGGEGEKLPQLAKEYEAANPGVRIEVTAIPWGQAHDKLAGAIAAKTTPDLSMMGTTWMPEFGRTGALDPVPSLIDTTKFFPAALEPPTVDKTLYGVPWYVDTRVLFYRKDILDKAGIKQAPRTWAELTAAAKAAQDKGGAKYGMYLPPGKGGAADVYLPWIWQQGGDILGADGTFTFDTPESVKALSYYQSFFTGKLAPMATQPGDAERWFVDGSLAMQITGPWMVSKFLELGGPGFADKFAVAPVPGDKTRTSFVGGADLVVFKDSPNRDAAWKFVNWLSDPAVQVKWYGLQKDLPSVQAAWQNPALRDNDKVAPFGEQLKDAKATPPIGTFQQIQKLIEDQSEKLIVGGVSPENTAKALQQGAERIGTGA